MRRIVAALLSLLLTATGAHAISDAQIPVKITITWGASAPALNITCPMPNASQIGITPGRASWTDGFPPVTFAAPGAGGVPPFGADFNGAFCQLSQWVQWSNARGPIIYDTAFSTAVNGYPKGAIINNASQNGCLWVNDTDNNTSNPDTGGANWHNACPGGGVAGLASNVGNAYTITGTPIQLANGVTITFQANVTNNGATTFNYNGTGNITVNKQTPAGFGALTGGEIIGGMVVQAVFQGGQWFLMNGPFGYLTVPDQTLSGGANVTTLVLGTITSGTTTIDCGARPLQSFTNGGASTVAAPANDGSCMVMITNNSNAGAISFSGFTTNSNTGEPITTVNGAHFLISIARLSGVSTYLVKALQ